MSYSKYFGATMRDQGMLQLSPTQHRRMMNIAYLEGKLDGLKMIKKTLPPDEFHKYDLEIFRVDRQLTEQTGNLQPADLVKEMVMMSE